MQAQQLHLQPPTAHPHHPHMGAFPQRVGCPLQGAYLQLGDSLLQVCPRFLGHTPLHSSSG